MLAKKGYDVHVITTGNIAVDSEDIVKGVNVHRILPNYTITKDGLRGVIDALQFSLKSVKVLMRLSHSTDTQGIIDISISPLIPTFFIKLFKMASILKFKMCLTVHEVWLFSWLKFYPLHAIFGLPLEYVSYHLPDVIVTVSRYNFRKIARYLPMLLDRLKIIPNGIEPELLKYYEARHTMVPNSIITVSRLLKHKNVKSLLYTYNQLKKEIKDSKLFVVGDGPCRSELMEHIRRLGIRDVTYYPSLPKKRLWELLSKVQVFVLPSLREGFSIATLEAMAVGLPPLCLNSPYSAVTDYIVNGFNGYLYSDEKMLINLLINILQDKKLYNKISRNAHLTALRFTWDKIVQLYEVELINEYS